MIRNAQQRRAMFYRMQTRRISFPLKGEGGRAQRNRGTLAAAGAGIGSAALLLAVSRGRPGLAQVLLNPLATGTRLAQAKVFSKNGKFLRDVGGSAWVSRKAAEGGEKWVLGMPLLKKGFNAATRSRRIVNGKISPLTTFDTAGPITKGTVAAKRYLKNKLANAIERASVWKIAGNRGQTLEAVQQAGDLAKQRTGKVIRRARNLLVTPRVFKTKSVTLPTNDVTQSVTIKIARRRPKRIEAPVERFVSRPFHAVSRKLKKADVLATRRMRLWVRRHNGKANA